MSSRVENPSSHSGTDPSAALQHHFGFNAFLDGQREIIDSLLAGRDVLAIMPTGGGKSLCFQLPALMRPGITMVVSPLIALMKDQVDGLVEKGLPATFLNSSLTLEEQRERLRTLDHYKLVYVAPERFRSHSFRAALAGVQVGLLAVDEAHCLSQWGHDFRPDYLRLREVRALLGNPQTAAFTATATPHVRTDICEHLALENPVECIRGFERPNLAMNIRPVSSEKEKLERLLAIVSEQKTGIVYCATRKRAEKVYSKLTEQKTSSALYHGGMEDAARTAAQEAFLQKTCDVIVATNAFGMGIDRPDVRFVVHFEVPGSVEAYYQEAGRAGRDGEAAWCELLFNYADTRTQEFFIEGSNPPRELYAKVYAALQAKADPQGEVALSIQELAEWLGEKNDMAISTCLSTLSRQNYIERYDLPGERIRGTRILHPDKTTQKLELDWEAIAAKEQSDRAKLAAMLDMVYAPRCRQQWILDYFGESDAAPCGNCDRCLQEESAERRAPTDEELLIARKALSGVARMSRKRAESWEARFGKGKIIQMLVGSRSRDILNTHLDQISTYGILRQPGIAYLQKLFREMESAGLLITQKGKFPLLTLTPRGEEVMQGSLEPSLDWPPLPGRAASPSNSPIPEGIEVEGAFPLDQALYERLRQKRSEIAQSKGGLPAYCIFSNATLEFFTRLRPKTIEAGMHIRGVGEKTASEYLPAFIEEIIQYEQDEK